MLSPFDTYQILFKYGQYPTYITQIEEYVINIINASIIGINTDFLLDKLVSTTSVEFVEYVQTLDDNIDKDNIKNIKYIIDDDYYEYSYNDLSYKVNRSYSVQLLEKHYSMTDVIKLVYTYSLIMFKLDNNIRDFTGYQWAIKPELFKEYKIQYEAFASPFNRTKSKSYFSLFDIDKKFGSSGNFFNYVDYKNGNYEVNPPFTEFVLKEAALKCLDILSKTKSFIFFIGPLWLDAEFYQLLSTSPYTNSFEHNKCSYIHNNTTINTNARSVYFFLSSK